MEKSTLKVIHDEALKIINSESLEEAQRIAELIVSIARYDMDIRSEAEKT